MEGEKKASPGGKNAIDFPQAVSGIHIWKRDVTNHDIECLIGKRQTCSIPSHELNMRIPSIRSQLGTAFSLQGIE